MASGRNVLFLLILGTVIFGFSIFTQDAYAAPAITITPTVGQAGTTVVTISGTGFGSQESVQIRFDVDGNGVWQPPVDTIAGNTQADVSGSFSGVTYTIPSNTPLGNHQFTTSPISNVVIFTVVPLDDADGDGVVDGDDNCPNIANPTQADADGDGIGDACEADTDNDGVIDDDDNCQSVVNPTQADADGDGIGDACEPDTDNDGVIDDDDNCPSVANPGQEDTDADGMGMLVNYKFHVVLEQNSTLKVPCVYQLLTLESAEMEQNSTLIPTHVFQLQTLGCVVLEQY